MKNTSDSLSCLKPGSIVHTNAQAQLENVQLYDIVILHKLSPLVKVCRNDPGRLKLLRLTATQPWCSGSQQTPSLRVATPWNERQKVSNDVRQTIKSQSLGGFNTAFLLCVPVLCVATHGKVKST